MTALRALEATAGVPLACPAWCEGGHGGSVHMREDTLRLTLGVCCSADLERADGTTTLHVDTNWAPDDWSDQPTITLYPGDGDQAALDHVIALTLGEARQLSELLAELVKRAEADL